MRRESFRRPSSYRQRKQCTCLRVLLTILINAFAVIMVACVSRQRVRAKIDSSGGGRNMAAVQVSNELVSALAQRDGQADEAEVRLIRMMLTQYLTPMPRRVVARTPGV